MDSSEINLEKQVEKKDRQLINLALEGLKSWDDNARIEAIMRLLRYDISYAIDFIAKAFKTDKSEARRLAELLIVIMKEAGDFKDQRTLNEMSLLINRYIRDWSEICLQGDKVRIEAIKDLINYGKKYAIYLIENILINDTSIKVRRLAELLSAKIKELKDSQDKTTKDALLLLIDEYMKDWCEISLQSLDDNLRIEAIKDLLNYDMRDVIDYLEKTLINDTSIKVRKLVKLLLVKNKQLEDLEDKIKKRELSVLIDAYIKVGYKLSVQSLNLLYKNQIEDLYEIAIDEFMNNENPGVKRRAVVLLNKLKNPRVVTHLLEELKRTEDTKLKRAIIRGIKNYQSLEIIHVLEDMYKKEMDDGIRENLIKALYHVNNEDGLQLLKDALMNDESETVRKRAAILLGRADNKDILGTLSNALNDVKNKSIKKEIVIGLGGEGKHLYDIFLDLLENDHDLEVKIAAVKGLGRTGDKRIYAHLLNIINSEEDVELRTTAIQAMGSIHDLRAVNVIIPYLKHKNKDVKISSALALGKLRDAIAVKHLCDLLNDQDIDVKIASSRALKMIRDPSATEPLVSLLDDKNEDVKIGAATALAYLGEPSVFSLLVKSLENENIKYNTRLIIESLGVLGDKRAVPYIIDKLNKGSSGIKATSIMSLGLLGDRQAIPHLKNLLNASFEPIKFRAAIVLGYFKVKAAYKIIYEALKSNSPYYRTSAVRSLAELNGRKYIDLIISAIKDSNTEVRKTALNVFMNVARIEMAFLANYLDLSSTPEVNINKDKFPKPEILDAFKKDYFRKMKINANRIKVNTIYKILLMIGYIESRSELIQKLNEIKNETKPDKDSKLYLFQEEEYETEEIIIDDAWFDRILNTNAIKNHYNTRPKQQVFREKVLERYGTYCAVCGLRVKELLTAAHIIPKEYKGVDDPRNALILCSLHHKAFDSGLFGIEPDTLEIHYKPKGPKGTDFNIRYDNINHLHNKPHPDVLRWRWNIWLKMLNDDSNKK